jgi:hypothetical protein
MQARIANPEDRLEHNPAFSDEIAMRYATTTKECPGLVT